MFYKIQDFYFNFLNINITFIFTAIEAVKQFCELITAECGELNNWLILFLFCCRYVQYRILHHSQSKEDDFKPENLFIWGTNIRWDESLIDLMSESNNQLLICFLYKYSLIDWVSETNIDWLIYLAWRIDWFGQRSRHPANYIQ